MEDLLQDWQIAVYCALHLIPTFGRMHGECSLGVYCEDYELSRVDVGVILFFQLLPIFLNLGCLVRGSFKQFYQRIHTTLLALILMQLLTLVTCVWFLLHQYD